MMFKSVKANNRFYTRIRQLKEFVSQSGISFWVFIIPLLLSFVSAVFQGIGAGLLIPMLKGIIEKDFGFIKEISVLENIFAMLPHYFVSTNTQIFLSIATIIFIATIIHQGSSYLGNLYFAYNLKIFMSGIRKFIFNRYLSFGKLFFDSNSFGYLNNILINFTYALEWELQHFLNAIGGIFIIIIYLIVMLLISWQMTMITLLVLPIMYFGVQKIIKKIKKASKEVADYRGKLSKKSFDVLSCISLVKSYSFEEKEKRDFERISDTTANFEYSVEKKYLLISPLQEIFILIAILFLVTVIVFIIVKDESAGVSGFLVYFYILKKCSYHMASFQLIRGGLARMEGPAREILKVFDDKDKYYDIGGKNEFKVLQKEIQINSLSFSYGRGIKTLEDVTFSIPKGKMTAIVGPTGAGKTTIINLLLRFYDCPPSSIFVDGVDIREFTLNSLRQHIAIVSQETLLFNDTLRVNITYGLEGILEEQLIDAVKKARLFDFIMKLPKGFDTFIGDRGVQLSGGEKQRVSIARAMLKGSEILILDEATSSLDTRTEKLIQEAIEKAAQDKTVIAIAHRLSTIKNADKIAVIEEGRLIEEGSLQDLLDKKGKFYQYWQEQKFY